MSEQKSCQATLHKVRKVRLLDSEIPIVVMDGDDEETLEAKTSLTFNL